MNSFEPELFVYIFVDKAVNLQLIEINIVQKLDMGGDDDFDMDEG